MAHPAFATPPVTEPARRPDRRLLCAVGAVVLAAVPWSAADGEEPASCLTAPTQACILALAADAAGQIEDDERRSDVLEDVVRFQTLAGDIDGAMTTARRIHDRLGRRLAMGAIIRAQARAGEIEAALETAQRIDSSAFYRVGLVDIAVAKARKGDVAGALGMLMRLNTPSDRVDVLRAVATAQADVGDDEAAGRTLDQALNEALDQTRDAARRIEQGHVWSWAHNQADVIGIMGQIGSIDGAVAVAAAATETASGFADGLDRSRAFGQIATALAEIGAFDAARQTAEQAGDGLPWREGASAHRPQNPMYRHHRMLANIAMTLAEGGDETGAVDLALSIAYPTICAAALRNVAVIQVSTGALDSALDTLATLVDVTIEEADGAENLLFVHESRLFSVPRMQARLGDDAGARTSARLLAEAVAGNEHLENPALSLTTVAHIQATVDDSEGARATLAAAMERADETALEPSDETAFLRAFAGALAALGDTDAALAMIDRMDDSGHRDALSHVAISHAEAGAVSTALNLAIGIEDPEHRADALAGIGRTLGGQ